MGTLFDYIDWRGDITFDEFGPCEVDSLILSHISYLDLYKIAPASVSAKGVELLSAVKKYVNTHKGEGNVVGLIIPPQMITGAVKAARSKRFGTLRIVGHVNHVDIDLQEQFSATTFLMGEDKCFVAFRGTDDTIVGWKESLNMSFMLPIPAQTEALEYLESVGEAYPRRKIYVAGHSKGGNLAVYAAVKCRADIKERIVTAYNLDGPGFDKEFIASQEYLEMRERIRTLIPQSSIVGMLLEHEEHYEVVQSNTTGLLQHNGFSWEVMGGRFVHHDSVTAESKYIDVTLKKWLSEISIEERKRIIDALYEILSSTSAKTLTDLSAEKFKVIKAWGTLDDESKKVIKRMVGLILKRKIKTEKPEDLKDTEEQVIQE